MEKTDHKLSSTIGLSDAANEGEVRMARALPGYNIHSMDCGDMH